MRRTPRIALASGAEHGLVPRSAADAGPEFRGAVVGKSTAADVGAAEHS